MNFRQALVLATLLCATADAEVFPTGGEVGPGVPPFSVRPGYRVTLAAENLGESRFMEFDDKGTLYLSQPAAGVIMALRDKDGDGVYETRTSFVTGKPKVHGLCFKNGWLWFTQSGAVLKARDTNGDGQADERQGRGHERHLEEPGGGVHVPGQAGQDAAGLHLPQSGQRQVEQPVVQGPAEGEHDPRVQELLPVVLDHPG